jgi:hypothetical protein
MPSQKPRPITDANSFIRGELAHLWPAISTASALQKHCAAILPQLFAYCSVLHLEGRQLIVAAPSAAFASKLKQQLPKLQNALQQAGFAVETIKIKVQTRPIFEPEAVAKKIRLSEKALQAFDALEHNLDSSAQNAGLRDALKALLARQRAEDR